MGNLNTPEITELLSRGSAAYRLLNTHRSYGSVYADLRVTPAVAQRSIMSDRRAYPRIPGSALPWLTAFSTRTPALDLLDISSGGALITTPTRLTPGDREVFVLQGEKLVKVVGWVVRAEVTRLTPSLSFTSAIRFAEPVPLTTFAWHPDDQPRDLVESAMRQEFARVLRGLRNVIGVRVSPVIITQPGQESIYFAVPDSTVGKQRLLQVFFALGTLPSTEDFLQLRHLAMIAAGLPDVDTMLAGTHP
jgi:hypothetical protein